MDVTATPEPQLACPDQPAESDRGPQLLRRLPLPSLVLQKRIALVNLIAQIGIMTTGVTVRVTGSGLGCETWPRCNADSFVPVPGAQPWVHQAIEFGNRMLTFVLVAVAVALVLAVLRAGRRAELVILSLLMPLGIVAQAVIGGVSVRMQLEWWTVAIHLIPSMILAWCAAVLYVRIGERDDVTPRTMLSRPLRILTVLAAVMMTAVVATGTMVTGAGPHAGDQTLTAEHRLQMDIQFLVHLHAELMHSYLALIIGLVCALYAVHASRVVKRRALILVAMIITQAAVGLIQYWTGLPETLVVLHVTLAGATVAQTAAVWAAARLRDPELPDLTRPLIPEARISA